VGRPARPAGEPLWRGGYDQLRREDRLVVVPAGWAEAYWWEDKQADNLAAILRRLKRDYHVDDNRVSLTGVSDGGTGAYFFAFKQPTDWSSFQPFIAHPAVLRNPQSGGGHWLFFENLLNKPLYIVNGEVDRLYPAESVEPFIELLDEIGVDHVFRVIENGGHNTQWLPAEAAAIERFKAESVRDPLPDRLNWITERSDRYNRNHWLVIDELSQPGRPGLFEVRREDNRFVATSDGVKRFTLLLSPDEVDFSRPIEVEVDGEIVFSGTVEPSASTLLDWLERDWDRSMLFTAALSLELD
jgi:predicted esterase